MAHPKSNATSLLEPGELAELGPPEAVRLPLELVDPNPNNPRRALVEVADLAASIKEFGLLQPVTVRRQGERYELLGGHRRRAAFSMLAESEPFNVAWRTIPAVVRTFDDDTAYLALLAGQLQARNWNPREEAAALETLASTRTLDEVGRLVHRSGVWVSHRLRVYADAVLSGYVQTGRLTVSVADELRLVSDPALRRDLAERAVAEGWEREKARSEVRKLKTSRMVSQIGRLSRDLLAALSVVQPEQIPPETALVLNSVRRRIMALARGPVMPSIEAAERVAGVTSQAKRHRTRLRVD